MNLRSLRKTADLLGASKSTIQRWVRNSPILCRQRAARKATTAAVARIIDVLSSNPFETPARIAIRIREELGLCLSASGIRFWIRRSGITRKKASRPVCTADVHDKRLAFATDYSAVYDPDRVISIDESSFYFDMKPTHGYCHRSHRLRVPSRPGGRTRWSLLMAVSNERVVGWRLEKGSINGTIFADFMSTLNTEERDVVLMDNASIHKTSLVMDTIISRGLTPCFLPPYTPDFQPIEHCFSILKNTFRRLPTTAFDVTPSTEDVIRRLEASLPALTSSSLAAFFDVCWRRTVDLLARAGRVEAPPATGA
jgi:transposase